MAKSLQLQDVSEKETRVADKEENKDLLSYRVGEVEKSLKSIEGKIDAFINGFAPMREIDRLDKRIIDVQTQTTQRVVTLEQSYQKHVVAHSDYPLIRKMVFAAAGIILVAVIGAIVALVVIKK